MREPPQHEPSFPEQVPKRFRLVPNFFGSTPDAPETIERLWVFAAAAASFLSCRKAEKPRISSQFGRHPGNLGEVKYQTESNVSRRAGG